VVEVWSVEVFLMVAEGSLHYSLLSSLFLESRRINGFVN
jgi:hypothetical protein